MGVFRLLPKGDLVSLCGEISTGMVSYLAAEDRFDVLESDRGLFAEAVRIALDRGGRFLLPRQTRFDTGHFISSFGLALDPNIYVRAIDSQMKHMPLSYHAVHRRYYAPQKFAAAQSVEDVADPLLIVKIDKFLGLFRELSELPIAVWSTTLAPWSKLIGEGVCEFGSSPVFDEIAVISAGIHSKLEQGRVGTDLFDAAVPLCERSRYARLRSGSPRWWLAQLDAADNESKVDFALINMIAWATPRTMAQISNRLSGLLDGLDERKFRRLVEIATRSSSPDKAGIKGTQMVGALNVVSPRALALLMRRSHPADVDIIFEGALKDSGTKDSIVLSMVAEMAVRRAIENPAEWKGALPIVRRAYSKDAMRDLPFVGPHAERSEMPVPVALEVLRQASQYPLHLIALADASLTKVVGAAAKPVGSIAQAEDWFGVGAKQH